MRLVTESGQAEGAAGGLSAVVSGHEDGDARGVTVGDTAEVDYQGRAWSERVATQGWADLGTWLSRFLA